MIEEYAAFYTSERFWAGKVPEFNGNNFMQKMCKIEKEYTYLDGKIDVKICKDGMFMIRDKGLEVNPFVNESNTSIQDYISIETRYLNLLNCIYFVFVSSFLNDHNTRDRVMFSYFNLYDMTLNDTFRITFEDEKFKGCKDPKGIGNSFINERFSVSSHYDITLNKKESRMVIEDSTFKIMDEELKLILANEDNILILSNLVKSISEFKVCNFSLSLILSWFIIETYLYKLWNEYLIIKKNESNSINKKRMEYLNNKDYSASIVSNILELAGILENNEFLIIDSIRKERNRIVHDSKNSTNFELCVSAFMIIQKFYNKRLGTNIMIDHSLKF